MATRKTARTRKASRSARSTAAPKRGAAAGHRTPSKARATPPAPDVDAPSPGDDELLDMSQAIAILKTSRPTFYRWLRSGKVRGMKVGRQWRFRREDIERFLAGQQPRIDLPGDLTPLIETLADRLRELGVEPATDTDADPPRHAGNLMIQLGVHNRASDIHLAPDTRQPSRGGMAWLRYRIDGVLYEVARFDLRLLPALIAQWKILCACDPAVHDRPQDGRGIIEADGQSIDLRLCFVPSQPYESVTIRLWLAREIKFEFARLLFSSDDQKTLHDHVTAPNGLIVTTGPAGSGKTTTLYACLELINQPDRKILTIEDPIEYRFDHIVQTQIDLEAGLTHERALRSFFRSDPDVIMVGEIRDLSTLELSLQAALTGHLVLTQLHTNDAATAVTRMIDVGADPFVVAESLRLIIAQRLVRQLCPKCSKPTDLTATQTQHAIELASTGGLNWDAMDKQFHAAVGCATCAQTGYRGRTLVAEMLTCSGPIRTAIAANASTDKLRQVAIGEGMTTMQADGVRRAAAGETTMDEVIRATALAR